MSFVARDGATELRPAPFGRLLTAMVTPFDATGGLDLDAAAALARYLVDEQRNDGLVVNGTTGEAPTTTDQEKQDLVRVVAQAVGDRAHIVAGVGTFSTEHTIRLAHEAEDAGADGLLVVTPYYSKPPQTGLLRHFQAVAEAVDTPIMMYDIPGRTATPLETPTLIELAAHPRLVAVKDAKGALVGSAQVMDAAARAGHGLAYYSGDDGNTLPLLAVGGSGLVGTSTHFTGVVAKAMIEAYLAGRVADALDRYRQALPLFTGIFATQGCILVKAGLAMQGRPVGGLRLPLPEATPEQRAALAVAMRAVGVPLLNRVA